MNIRWNKEEKREEFLINHLGKVLTFAPDGGCEEDEDFDFQDKRWNGKYVPCSEKKFNEQSFVGISEFNEEAVKAALEELGFDERKTMSTIKCDTVFITAASAVNKVDEKYIAFQAKLPRSAMHTLELLFTWLIMQIEEEMQ